MPAIVDHDSRREHVARIAADLIARVGLNSVTMRQIAAEAGFSTAIVTHYFSSKHELLLHTYRSTAISAQARVDAVLAQHPGDVLASLEALVPRDEESRRDWKVYIAFWHIAALDPVFAAEQAAQALNARRILHEALQARSARGWPPAEAEVATVAQRLLLILVGLSVQAVFDPVNWSADAIRRYLVAELGPLCDR